MFAAGVDVETVNTAAPPGRILLGEAEIDTNTVEGVGVGVMDGVGVGVAFGVGLGVGVALGVGVGVAVGVEPPPCPPTEGEGDELTFPAGDERKPALTSLMISAPIVRLITAPARATPPAARNCRLVATADRM